VLDLELTERAEAVARRAAELGGGQPCLHHWMLAIIDCCPEVVEALSPASGDLAETRRCYEGFLEDNDPGMAFSLETVTAALPLTARPFTETDLARAVLLCAGFPLRDATADTLEIRLADASSTPTLDQLGIDLTAQARTAPGLPVVGRDAEIQQVLETLCRRTKRNPLLLGPAGVGKTAIVEGLARRIAAGDVPAGLRDARLVQLTVTALTAGCTHVGDFEARMQAVVAEASQPHIILFLDEAHTMIGAGVGRGNNDLANMLKPALARGDVACIAATTDEEFHAYFEHDGALLRRFQPITVPELDPTATLAVLRAARDVLAPARGVAVDDELLAFIVDFAGRYLRYRHFPDKAIDILDQCLACAVAGGRDRLTAEDAAHVARRLAGMPEALLKRLPQLRARLLGRSQLPPAAVEALITRLGVTLRGYDLRAVRPNAVLLLLNDAAGESAALAGLLAETLFADAGRTLAIDFSRFTQPGDVTMLVGAPPGFVGYERPVALHQVIDTPWCVLRCENLHAANPAALEVLAQGLREGVITLADGKRAYLCETLVLLTAHLPTAAMASFGLGEAPSPADLRERAGAFLGASLLEQADLLCAEVHDGAALRGAWLREALLAELCARFSPLGVQVVVEDSALSWLLAQGRMTTTQTEWERLIDEQLSPQIIPHLPAARPAHSLVLHVWADGESCRVTPGQGDTGACPE
jgi:ATP-dependent Clp protease ATP-binding subunit ClpC